MNITVSMHIYNMYIYLCDTPWVDSITAVCHDQFLTVIELLAVVADNVMYALKTFMLLIH